MFQYDLPFGFWFTREFFLIQNLVQMDIGELLKNSFDELQNLEFEIETLKTIHAILFLQCNFITTHII